MGRNYDLVGIAMELRHLRYFITVANERNFSRAAEKLHIAQPPLSRQIRQLEEELGLTLIDREARPLKLTEAGRLFYKHASQVLNEMDRLRLLMRRYASAEKTRFVIGFVGSTIYGPLPTLIRRFRASAPHIDLHLAEMTTLEQISALKDGSIDAGFGRLRFDDPAVRRVVLEKEPLVAALPPDHPLAAASACAISLARLAEETLIVYPRPTRPSYADQLLSLFRDHGLAPVHVMEARELQTAIGLVAAEAGICVVPASVERLRRDDVVYRPIADAGAVTPLIMSYRTDDMSAELELLHRISQSLYGEKTDGQGEGAIDDHSAA